MKDYSTLTDQQKQAIQYIAGFTNKTFDLWRFSGRQFAGSRGHVLTLATGRYWTNSKSGITAMRDELNRLAEVTGDCIAEREDNFIRWAHAMFVQIELDGGVKAA